MASDQTLLDVERTFWRLASLERGDRSHAGHGLYERTVQRLVQLVLQRAAGKGQGVILEIDGQVRHPCDHLHCHGGLRGLSESDVADTLAPLAYGQLSR